MKIQYQHIILYSLILLSAIIFCNLNAVITKLIGISAPTSPLILLLSVVITIVGIFGAKVRPGKLLFKLTIAFYLMYLILGLLNLQWDSSFLVEDFSIWKLLRSYIPSMIIITAFYVGFSALKKQNESFSVVKFLAPFFAVSVGIMVFGPMLGLFESMRIGVDEARASGFFANPNEAGAAANYALVAFLALFVQVRWKLLTLPLIILAIVASFYSFSKASIIVSVGLLILLVLWSFFAMRRNSAQTNLYMLLFVGGLYFCAQLIYLNFDTILGELTYAQRSRVKIVLALANGQVDSSTTSDRSYIFTKGFETINQNPVWGSGLGTFHKLKNSLIQIGVHNTFIMIWGESGIFTLLLFLLIFGLMFIVGWWHPNPGYSILIVGVIAVYMINVCGTGHNALDDRSSNALFGIILMLTYHNKKSLT